MKDYTLEQLQVAYGMVINHLKENKKEGNDRNVKVAILVLIELNKRIKKLSSNNSDKTNQNLCMNIKLK